MRLINSLIISGCLICWPGSYTLAQDQEGTTLYKSHGYFIGMNLADSMLLDGDYLITITPKLVKIFAVDTADTSVPKLYLERRTMSGLKYTTLEGQNYVVWKLGDRKMILREQDGRRYLSLYRTDDYGLPAEYVTFLLEE